jgi:hypothetical protein
VDRVAPGGVLFIVNQGEREREVQRDLLTGLAITATDLGLIESPLSPFRRPRFGFRWVRPLGR